MLASRPAVVGDELTVTRFPNAYTTGMATAEDPTTVVCMLPGTEIAFDGDIKQRGFSYGDEIQAYSARVAKFTQICTDQRFRHHDAIEFLVDGKEVQILINELVHGQKVTVLQLGKQPEVSHVDLPANAEHGEPNAPVDAPPANTALLSGWLLVG